MTTPRMPSPAFSIPGLLDHLVALGKTTQQATDVPVKLLHLLNLRASQINNDGPNTDRFPRLAKAAGETSDERILAVASWRNTPYYTDEERAALALTEAVTRIADRDDAVPDHVWEEASKHFSDQQLAGIVVAIATVNFWSRLNVATRQIANPDA